MNIQRIYFLYLCPEGRIGRVPLVAGLMPLVVAGVRRPMAFGFKTDEIRRTIIVRDTKPV